MNQLSIIYTYYTYTTTKLHMCVLMLHNKIEENIIFISTHYAIQLKNITSQGKAQKLHNFQIANKRTVKEIEQENSCKSELIKERSFHNFL